HKRLMLALAAAAVVFGGAQIQFLRPSIFQESLFWASAIAALFVWLAFRWCVDPAGRKQSHLVAMAVLAGLCLLTRVSTSLGPYLACGGIFLTELIAALRRRDGGGPAARLIRVSMRT